MNRPIKVVHYPHDRINPYQSLMCQGTEAHEISTSFIEGGPFKLITHSLFGNGEVLHLHWVSGPVVSKSRIGAFVRLAVFHTSLIVWRLRQKKIVWTVHNLVNHDKRRLWLDQLNSILVARFAHHILVHGKGARPLAARWFRVPESKIYVVHHGNYEGIVSPHPLIRERDGVRFLFFGAIRSYKGVPELITAFGQLSGPHQLHIAGRVNEEELQNQIEVMSIGDDRVTHELALISNHGLEELLRWCDVVVLPYRDILTSGSLLMALSAGRPVVAPRAGLITEYVDDKGAFLYNLSDPGALARALQESALDEDLAVKATAAWEQSLKFDWKVIGTSLARIYRGTDPSGFDTSNPDELDGVSSL